MIMAAGTVLITALQRGEGGLASGPERVAR